MLLNPGWDDLQAALDMGEVAAKQCTAKDGLGPAILLAQFCHRDVEFAMQASQQGFDPAALVFERLATGDCYCDGEQTDGHRMA